MEAGEEVEEEEARLSSPHHSWPDATHSPSLSSLGMHKLFSPFASTSH